VKSGAKFKDDVVNMEPSLTTITVGLSEQCVELLGLDDDTIDIDVPCIQPSTTLAAGLPLLRDNLPTELPTKSKKGCPVMVPSEYLLGGKAAKDLKTLMSLNSSTDSVSAGSASAKKKVSANSTTVLALNSAKHLLS
jgi:hypothetical protein